MQLLTCLRTDFTQTDQWLLSQQAAGSDGPPAANGLKAMTKPAAERQGVRPHDSCLLRTNEKGGSA